MNGFLGGPKPIETRYKGYRFRSRLEARWAVFLDAISIEWEYEKEGYNISGDWYLPDFWLPYDAAEKLEGWGEWLEIKPLPLTERETSLLAGLTKLTGHRAYAVCGQPWGDEHRVYVFQHHHGGHPVRIPIVSSGGIIEVNAHQGTEFEHIGLIEFKVTSAQGDFCFPSGHMNKPGDLQLAFQAAREARFEHEEHPSTYRSGM